MTAQEREIIRLCEDIDSNPYAWEYFNERSEIDRIEDEIVAEIRARQND